MVLSQTYCHAQLDFLCWTHYLGFVLWMHDKNTTFLNSIPKNITLCLIEAVAVQLHGPSYVAKVMTSSEWMFSTVHCSNWIPLHSCPKNPLVVAAWLTKSEIGYYLACLLWPVLTCVILSLNWLAWITMHSHSTWAWIKLLPSWNWDSKSSNLLFFQWAAEDEQFSGVTR